MTTLPLLETPAFAVEPAYTVGGLGIRHTTAVWSASIRGRRVSRVARGPLGPPRSLVFT